MASARTRSEESIKAVSARDFISGAFKEVRALSESALNFPSRELFFSDAINSGIISSILRDAATRIVSLLIFVSAPRSAGRLVFNALIASALFAACVGLAKPVTKSLLASSPHFSRCSKASIRISTGVCGLAASFAISNAFCFVPILRFAARTLRRLCVVFVLPTVIVFAKSFNDFVIGMS